MSKYNLLYGWRNGSNLVAQTKSLLLSRTIACKKTVEYLHSQLVRKGRAERRENHTHPTKGAIYTVEKYNIHNNTSEGYDYNDPERLGIAQLLHGGSPFANLNNVPHSWSTTDDRSFIASTDESSQSDYSSIVPRAWLHSIYNNLNGYNVLFYHPDYYLGTANEYAIIDTITMQIGHYSVSSGSGENSTTTYYLVANATVSYKAYRQIFDETANTYSHEYLSDGSANIDFSGMVDRQIYDENEGVYTWDADAGGKISRLDFSAFYRASSISSATTHNGDVTTTTYSNLTPKMGENAYVSFSYNYPNAKKLRILGFGSSWTHTITTMTDIENFTPIFLDDGRVLLRKCTGGYSTLYRDGGGDIEYWTPYEYEYTILETYKQSDDKPTRGNFHFAHDWNFHYLVKSYDIEDSNPFSFKSIVRGVVACVVTMVGAYAGQVYLGGLVGSTAGMAAGGFAGAVSGMAAGAMIGAMISGIEGFAGISKALGVAGSVLSIGSAIANIAKSLTTNVATTANSASSLSASSSANAAGLTQTSSLYTGGVTGTAQSFTTTSQGYITSTTFTNTYGYAGHTMSYQTTLTSSFGPNGLLSQTTSTALYGNGNLVSGFSNLNPPSWFNTALEIGKTLKEAYGVYSDTKSLFKKPNDFSDDSMPTNEDEEDKRAGWGATDEDGFTRFYDPWADEVDLGLEPGTLLYTPSVRERLAVDI